MFHGSFSFNPQQGLTNGGVAVSPYDIELTYIGASRAKTIYSPPPDYSMQPNSERAEFEFLFLQPTLDDTEKQQIPLGIEI